MPYRVDVATSTDPGLLRSRNEDAVQADAPGGFAVVADGMGGHPAGDVASRLAVGRVADALTRGSASNLDAGLGDRMAEAVRLADGDVRREGRADPDRAGMGTTLTALVVDPSSGRFVIGHVGDSRAYRWRQGSLELLTRDQTWVQAEVEAGRLTSEQARRHPWSSVLSQALGLETAAVPSLVEGEVRAGDLYLLCSDGLTAMLTDDDIVAVLEADTGEGQGLEATADALVARANDAGGVDNITVALLAVTPSD